MKYFLLCSLLILGFGASAQNKTVNQLPVGKYETIVKSTHDKWDRGDIILLDDHQYKLSINAEVGEYKFSPIAQRLFFTSGPLKNLFAKTSLSNDSPAIVLPAAENTQAGVRSEIWCYLKQ